VLGESFTHEEERNQLQRSPRRTEAEARKSDLAHGPCNENESRAGDWTQIESPHAETKTERRNERRQQTSHADRKREKRENKPRSHRAAPAGIEPTSPVPLCAGLKAEQKWPGRLAPRRATLIGR
jgi:hypothetical protein